MPKSIDSVKSSDTSAPVLTHDIQKKLENKKKLESQYP
jgi:hypothetical protein